MWFGLLPWPIAWHMGAQHAYAEAVRSRPLSASPHRRASKGVPGRDALGAQNSLTHPPSASSCKRSRLGGPAKNMDTVESATNPKARIAPTVPTLLRKATSSFETHSRDH